MRWVARLEISEKFFSINVLLSESLFFGDIEAEFLRLDFCAVGRLVLVALAVFNSTFCRYDDTFGGSMRFV